MSKMKNFCCNCNQLQPIQVKTVLEEYQIKGESVSINAQVAHCAVCGSELWNEELDNQNIQLVYATYRSLHDLLTPEQIKDIRCKYKLSQTAFSKILGLGEKTITRYENGAVQDKAQDNLICLVKNSKVFKTLWEKGKHLLTPSERSKTETALMNMDPILNIAPISYPCSCHNDQNNENYSFALRDIPFKNMNRNLA